jgi:hypothetical protein
LSGKAAHARRWQPERDSRRLGCRGLAAELNADGPLLEINVSDVHVRDRGTTQLAGAFEPAPASSMLRDRLAERARAECRSALREMQEPSGRANASEGRRRARVRPVNEAEWLPIEYRDFWDVPRLSLVRLPHVALLFDCRFNR